MIHHINILALLVVAVVIAALLGGPILLIAFGWRGAKRGLLRGRIMCGFGIALFLAILMPVALHLYLAGPWHTRIVTKGVSPSGQEYCVIQTFQDFVEPYQISFYIRDANRLWRWNYLDHEGYAWRTASASFSDDKVSVYRNGKPYRSIAMPTGTVDIVSVPKGYANYYCPPEFSVEDVFEFQKRKTR
ncbi:MAG: hypothetical protein GXY44_02930 [Phycisphaerales bacterium]|jgi:hypothetical protein|nr:hypothetical protein [Phycisphaerales bacterium]